MSKDSNDPGGAGFAKLLKIFARHARRAVVLVVGTTVVLFGTVFLFTPGPAVVVIPTGLAILSVEFVWARRLLRRFKTTIENNVRKKEAGKEDE